MKFEIDKIFNISSDEEFESMALDMFDIQIKMNPTYRDFCEKILKSNTPNNIKEIPFLPINFFKTHDIICEGEIMQETFLSSGTEGVRSKHLISNISVYQKSFEKCFNQFYGDPKKYCLLALLPNYIKQKNSSLMYMVDHLIKQSGHPKSGFYLDDYANLSEVIKENEENKEVTILFGVSYALIALAQEFPQELHHTTIIETGGTKGNKKEIVKEELHEILKHNFNIQNVHSEYGMTELLSQSYSKEGNSFISPNWKKVLIRDINDPLTIIGENRTGGINIIDLANINSCPFIATQDLGKIGKDGTFSVLGRFDNADLRGCNLMQS